MKFCLKLLHYRETGLFCLPCLSPELALRIIVIPFLCFSWLTIIRIILIITVVICFIDNDFIFFHWITLSS